jgi:sugar lactone lactonase YvrE
VTEIRLLVDAKYILGECPLWDVQSQRLYWVDSHHGRIFQASAEGRAIKQWTLPSTIGSMALRRNGGAVVSLRSGLHLFDFDSGRSQPIAHPEEGLPGVRLNDGKVDRQGRFVVGSFDEALYAPESSPVPRGSLYRLDTDMSLTRLEQGFGVANGPCWSPDGRRFYLADTWAKTVWLYDWDAAGVPRNKRVFVEGSGPGAPDGATVDSEGYLWNAWIGAGTGGGDIRRYSPDGRLDRRIELPTAKVTSVMFGGPNLDVLYVTSMGLGGFPEDRAADGGLFAIMGLGVQGIPEPRFGG